MERTVRFATFEPSLYQDTSGKHWIVDSQGTANNPGPESARQHWQGRWTALCDLEEKTTSHTAPMSPNDEFHCAAWLLRNDYYWTEINHAVRENIAYLLDLERLRWFGESPVGYKHQPENAIVQGILNAYENEWCTYYNHAGNTFDWMQWTTLQTISE